ncbi:leucine-rich repeat protein, partial [Glaciibacter psychrotolerans]
MSDGKLSLTGSVLMRGSRLGARLSFRDNVVGGNSTVFETGFTHARSQGRIHRLAGRATAALTVTLLLGTGQLLLATPASADPLPETYTVDIDLNGHGDDYSVQVPRSERLSEPAAPSAPGWNFTGWYDDAAATEKAYLPTDIYGAATLYAGWRSITESVVVDGLVLAVDPLDFTSGASVVHNQPGPLAVTIPAATVINGQTYPVTTVGAAAFRNNGLSAVTLPNSLTSIGFMAFASNTLTSLSLPPSVTTIGAYAFLENKITTLSLADSVTHIGEGAFAFNALTSVRIPNGLTTILGIAFGYNALSTVTIPDSVTTIGSGAFAVNRLTSVNIGASVQNIESDAFMWNSLTSVTIPAAVTAIGANAFGSNFDVDWRDYPDFENMPTAVDTPSTLTRVDFLGAAPAHLVPGPYLGEEPWDDQPSLGHEGLLTVFYSLGFEGTDPATHFTAGSWQGYASQAVATVNFSLNGHGSAAAQRVVPGARATDPKPTAAGWTFTGWYSDPGLTQPFAFSTAISTDLTLYAGWKANAVTPPASWKPTMKRISGTDRYATSVALSKAGFAKTAPVVYIATGTNYP